MAKKTPTQATVVETPVAETPVVETTEVVVPATPDVVVTERFEQLSSKLVEMATLVRDLQAYVKTVQKEVVKTVKSNKKTKRTVNPNVKKTPSGFAKPTKLSDALCDFLGEPHGTELARTEVTRRINAYIKANDLQDPADKRKIHPDTKLSKVLVSANGELPSFFTLQAQIKHNFIKV